MLTETETEETVFLVTFLSLAAIQFGGSGPPGPTQATPMVLYPYHYKKGVSFFLAKIETYRTAMPPLLTARYFSIF